MSPFPFYKYIEALCISPNITDERLLDYIDLCKPYQDQITSLFPNMHQIPLAAKLLADSPITLGAAIAYPLGNLPTEIKRRQIETAIQNGVHQIAIMMRIESLNAGDDRSAQSEAQALVDLVMSAGIEPALIANLALLNETAKHAAAHIAKNNAARLITASGMGVETSVEDLRLIRPILDAGLGITACGTINRAEQALDLLKAGADRICTPAPFEIISGLETLKRHGFQEG